MPSALLLPLITCSAVLVLGGVATLRDPAGLDRAVSSLRVPPPLDGRWARRALPWVEVALGVWLLLATGVLLVALAFGVLVLFSGYLALVARAASRPEPAECGCFGSVGDGRVTRTTVGRNALLVLAALLTLVAAFSDVALLPVLGTGGLWSWLLMTALTLAVGVLVTWRPAGSAAAPDVAGTRPDQHAVPARDGDYVRRPVPDAQVLTEDGSLVVLAHLAALSARLLVFISPGCGGCGRIAPLVPQWAAELSPVSVHAVLLDDPEVIGAYPFLADLAWFDPNGMAHRLLGGGSPSAVLLGTDGLLAGGPVLGEEAVRAFVEELRDHLAAETAATTENATAAATAAGPEALSDAR